MSWSPRVFFVCFSLCSLLSVCKTFRIVSRKPDLVVPISITSVDGLKPYRAAFCSFLFTNDYRARVNSLFSIQKDGISAFKKLYILSKKRIF